MLCCNCKHKHYDPCEDTMVCDLFEDDFPEEYERKDGEGCIFNENTIKGRIKAKEEAIIEFYKEMLEEIERERGSNDIPGRTQTES